jgi:hypothetical protein
MVRPVFYGVVHGLPKVSLGRARHALLLYALWAACSRLITHLDTSRHTGLLMVPAILIL